MKGGLSLEVLNNKGVEEQAELLVEGLDKKVVHEALEDGATYAQIRRLEDAIATDSAEWRQLVQLQVIAMQHAYDRDAQAKTIDLQKRNQHVEFNKWNLYHALNRISGEVSRRLPHVKF